MRPAHAWYKPDQNKRPIDEAGACPSQSFDSLKDQTKEPGEIAPLRRLAASARSERQPFPDQCAWRREKDGNGPIYLCDFDHEKNRRNAQKKRDPSSLLTASFLGVAHDCVSCC